MLRSLTVLMLLGTLGVLPATAQHASSPDPYRSRIELGPESYTWQGVRQANATQASPVMRSQGRFGGTTAPMPGRTVVKPFNTVVHEPTISPYMHLYREDRGNAAPNYHSFVLPQQQQYEANRQQASHYQQLQRQVRQASYAPTGNSGAARYGDTSHYYNR